MAVSTELWTEGNASICICIDDYEYKVIAWASDERLTARQMVEALEAQYPGVVFETRTDVSPGNIHAVGKRVL